MPLEIDGPSGGKRQNGAVVIGLINNMPDGALRATESQFSSLLAEASGARSVRLRVSYLSGVPRDAEAKERLESTYWPLESLLADPPDAVIVTGAEPRSHELEAEPYWPQLIALLDWTQAQATPSIWSCLAAHAAVLALDGIRRQRLTEKRFGVFTHRTSASHPLLQGIGKSLLTPHSRWNELPVAALQDAGYTLASLSEEAGADCFFRGGAGSLLCFQGHPEYEGTTLLLEYRRDVGRFLRGERDSWPALPHGYFPPDAIAQVNRFRLRAEAAADPAFLSEFPTAELAADLTPHWRPDAVRIYRNWLQQVTERKASTPTRLSMQV